MRTKDLSALKKKIVRSLSDDLLSGEWFARKKLETKCHPTFGHCYITAEAAYHLLGGKAKRMAAISSQYTGWIALVPSTPVRDYLRSDRRTIWYGAHSLSAGGGQGLFDPTSQQTGADPDVSGIGKN